MTGVQILRYTSSFQTFGYDGLNIVMSRLAAFFYMRGAVFYHEVSSWYCHRYYGTAQYLLILLRANKTANGSDTCTCLKHFVPEKSASCGVDKLFIFVFISVN